MRNLNNPKYVDGDFDDSISAAGTTQATATTLKANHNWITTVSADTAGVVLKSYPIGEVFTVTNASSTSCQVYPPSGSNFNGLSANVPVTLAANRTMHGRFFSSTKIQADY